jgi:tetratricopeptide (TPR) repeat protein
LLISYDPATISAAKAPAVAQEPSPPEEVATIEELYLTGLHLEQYRHATRQPETYWQEALRRDPQDSRVNNRLGLWRLRRGEFNVAAEHFQTAIARITRLNPNPLDGEVYYNLGITERFRKQPKEARDALYKATWNAAWRAPAFLALAELDACEGDWETALNHVQRSLRAEAENLNALNLLVTILSALGLTEEASATHKEVRALDLLDVASRWREGIAPADGQQRLDLAFDLLRSGQKEEAARVLRSADLANENATNDGSQPIILFTLAQLEAELGCATAEATYNRANSVSLNYCFPSRLEEMCVLQATIAAHPDCAAAHYLLGNLLYDRRRHEEAVCMWQEAARLCPAFPTVWRNLGIAMFNIRGDAEAAKLSFDRAIEANPNDARVIYERDQLWKRTGESPERRLEEQKRFPELVGMRDDLSVEMATLNNRLGRPAEALDLLLGRHFQPWEGGEGLVLAQYVRSRLMLGQSALKAGRTTDALEHFLGALRIPDNLSEARHLLANQSDIYYWIGNAYDALGDRENAATWWLRATRQRGDFQQMAVRSISGMTYWTAMAQLRLGQTKEAAQLLQQIHDYSVELEATEPKIDYFATSLPAMLLFEDDLQLRNRIEALFLRAQAFCGLNRKPEAAVLLREVLRLDCNHMGAVDLLAQTAEPAPGDEATGSPKDS